MTRPRRLLILLLTVAAVAGGSWWWREAMNPLQEMTYIPKAVPLTAEARLLQEYVRIDTTNPPGNETAGARWLGTILQKNGVPFEIIESEPGRGNLYARIPGRSHDGALLLLHHIDVMPADAAGWKRPPFSGAVDLDTMYGRGTLDMKGIGICELAAFLDVAHAKRPPEHDVVFLAVADEERGGAKGMHWLLDHRPELFAGVRYVLNEGGLTEMVHEEIRYFGIEIGGKVAVTATASASSPEPLRRFRIALEPFAAPEDPDRVLPEVRRYFHEIAPNRREEAALLTNIDQTIANGKFWLLPRGYRDLTQNVAAGYTVNRGEDGRYTMLVFMLDLPDQDPDQRLAWLESLARPYGITITPGEKNGPTPLSSEDTPMFGIIRANVQKEFGKVPLGSEILARSANDSRFLRARGIQCYGLSPYPVDFYQSTTIHGNDERVRVDWFAQGVKVMRGIVRDYAFGPQNPA